MEHSEAVETLAPERYLLNEMTVEDREAFEEHYFGCAECAADLRAGSAVIAGVRAGKAAQQPKRWAFWLPTAVAAGLAVFVAYQTSVVIPQAAANRGTQQPIVTHHVVPLTLGTTRGGNDEGHAVAGAQPFALKFDIEPVAGATGFDLEILDARGAVVETGHHVSAAEASESIEIVIPGGKLRPGRYTLNVKPQPSGLPSFGSFDVQ